MGVVSPYLGSEAEDHSWKYSSHLGSPHIPVLTQPIDVVPSGLAVK